MNLRHPRLQYSVGTAVVSLKFAGARKNIDRIRDSESACTLRIPRC